MSASNTDTPGRYDPQTQTYQLYHDYESDTGIATAIIDAVARLTETPPTDIGPLYEVVDPDSLDRLFKSVDGSLRQTDGKVTFTLHDSRVTVHSDGLIEIRLSDDS